MDSVIKSVSTEMLVILDLLLVVVVAYIAYRVGKWRGYRSCLRYVMRSSRFPKTISGGMKLDEDIQVTESYD